MQWVSRGCTSRYYSCLQCVGPNRYLFTVSYLTILVEPASHYIPAFLSLVLLVFCPSGETMGGLDVSCIE